MNHLLKQTKVYSLALTPRAIGVLRAIEDYLLRKGLSRKELPKKIEEYQKALKKYASPYNGKLLRQFDDLYDQLHIAGYYRRLLHDAYIVKRVLKSAEEFIKRLEG